MVCALSKFGLVPANFMRKTHFKRYFRLTSVSQSKWFEFFCFVLFFMFPLLRDHLSHNNLIFMRFIAASKQQIERNERNCVDCSQNVTFISGRCCTAHRCSLVLLALSALVQEKVFAHCRNVNEWIKDMQTHLHAVQGEQTQRKRQKNPEK